MSLTSLALLAVALVAVEVAASSSAQPSCLLQRSSQPSVLQAASNEQLSFNESLGFMTEDEESWKLRKSVHQAMRQELRESDKKYAASSLQNESGHTYWQWHDEPTFHCEFAQRIGNIGDGGKWVCDPERITKQVNSGGSCLVYSVGSNGQFGFEEGVLRDISPSCEVHVFDPAPAGVLVVFRLICLVFVLSKIVFNNLKKLNLGSV
ncbi:unnamed protein product [Polarella glacialis]|uniref:Methyltransferase domain-containing protein n=1 Tax=Polarella glacialis TaxID=89957 RepID=A0A813LYE6_POLGL|nr:unnamed protein product [Polarella glacialis]